jgi:RNA polymerase sigma factor (sigma-70 family)
MSLAATVQQVGSRQPKPKRLRCAASMSVDTVKPKVEVEEEELADDRVLARQAKDGDMAAFEELVTRYHGRLYGLIYNMTSNKEDTEDMLQDVLTKAYQALPKFKGDSSFYTWIYRIAINRTINFVKKRKRKTAMSLDSVDGGIERDPAYVELSSRESPIRDVNIGELQAKLNASLQTLSEKHRSVVVLHDIQGIPHHEIAAMLGVSEGTLRSRLYYARQHLQNELAEFAP